MEKVDGSNPFTRSKTQLPTKWVIGFLSLVIWIRTEVQWTSEARQPEHG